MNDNNLNVIHVLQTRNIYSIEDATSHALQSVDGDEKRVLHLDEYKGNLPANTVVHAHGNIDLNKLSQHFKSILLSVYNDKEVLNAKGFKNIVCHSTILERKHGIKRIVPKCIAGKRGYKGIATFIDFVDPMGTTKLAIQYLQFLLNTNLSLAVIVPQSWVVKCLELVKKADIPEDLVKIRPYVPMIHVFARESACVITSGIKVLPCLANKVPVLIPTGNNNAVVPVTDHTWDTLYNSDFYAPKVNAGESQLTYKAILKIAGMYSVDTVLRRNKNKLNADILKAVRDVGYDYPTFMKIANSYSKVFEHVKENFSGESVDKQYRELYDRVQKGVDIKTP